MTAEKLALYSGVVLSLLFSYVPGLSGWFDALQAVHKRLIMLILLLGVAGAVFGLSCSGLVDPVISCDKAGGWIVINAFVAAAIANQAAYALTKKG